MSYAGVLNAGAEVDKVRCPGLPLSYFPPPTTTIIIIMIASRLCSTRTEDGHGDGLCNEEEHHALVVGPHVVKHVCLVCQPAGKRAATTPCLCSPLTCPPSPLPTPSTG